MPTVYVAEKHLREGLGEAAMKDFDDLCFKFGIEFEGETSQKRMLQKEQGEESEAAKQASDDVLFKIDVPANRYDLLCMEGLVRALEVYMGRRDAPVFRTVAPSPSTRMTVLPSTAQVRPFVVCAILRGITFTPERYQSFIELQDKLHQNVCRKRTLVAIGTHDLDTLKGPFTYEALDPTQINFVPLNKTESFRADRLLEFYETMDSQHIGQYVHIIKKSPCYPVIFDSRRTVLSLPPIINGEHSKITLKTKNVFIECTATDLTKANIVLNTTVSMFSEYCAVPFTIEQVEVHYSNGTKDITPNLSSRTVLCSVDYINRSTGLHFSAKDQTQLLRKMQYAARVVSEREIEVDVPPTRSDVLHECDIMEDVAIAHGYNNIPRSLPQTVTVGHQQPLNKLSDLLRAELASAGYTEVLTFILCSHEEQFKNLKLKDDGSTAVQLANPKTKEFQICRTSLMPGMLKTLYENKKAALPIKIFEVSDVVLLDATNDVGARNERHLAAAFCNKTAELEHIHGLMDYVMQMLGLEFDNRLGYSIQPSNEPMFFPGRQASVIINKNQAIGTFGVLHPDVLKNYDLPFPVSYLELNIEPFVESKK